ESTAADRHEDSTTAVSALDGALGLARPGATRILVIVSDGRYKGTQHADGQKLVTRLAASGCLVIWIAPSDTANTMTGTSVVILGDPAATSQAVARVVAASARTASPRPGTPPGPRPGRGCSPPGMAAPAVDRIPEENAEGKEKAAGAEKPGDLPLKARTRRSVF